MKLMSTILISGMVALGAAAAAVAQDAAPQPPAGQAQPGPGPRGRPGGPPGGQMGERAPPSIGGVVGTVDSVSASGFVVTLSPGHQATVETSSATTYRKGKAASSASAVKEGQRVVAIGLATVGRGNSGSTVKATEIILQPAGGGTATSSTDGVPFQQGVAPVAKEVGKVPANYVQGEGTIISGPEASKAIQAALAAYTGGVVNRVVKLKTGEYEVHNVGVRWPHHLFVDKNFKFIGAQ
ncbi:hypothetical protein DJ021_02395 [Phenylobacterium hankyongense]|uniref:DUF5666 domain-containing protein n=1 Tax=Phenylobacterium hankyongense TaxID=1813876 RepID=A0A328AX52_9CAUL|nr:hypothetical protein [Phenylobacterium hankyongense]RAK58731.1 hypothetical protein DJ021_02395 [Phenylobacterium hankyongense]